MKKKDCTCAHRKVGRHTTCPDVVNLGITPGMFNTLGQWPLDEDVQKLHGGSGRITVDYRFQVPRLIKNRLMRRGFAALEGPAQLRITESGKAVRTAIHATNHWSRHEHRDDPG